MNLETKITIYKFTPQVFTLTHFFSINLPLFNSYLFILCYFKMWPSYYILKYKKAGGKLQLYKYQFMI
jgi:hypothetical protein